MPFLLGALDPSAVNQTHQAPVAMHAISVVFKPLLFPSPTILQYLPQVLTLSLPGVDTCDAVKTTMTLKLFATVLSWIPLKARYTDSDSFTNASQTYLSLSSRTPPTGQEETGFSIAGDKSNAKVHLNSLAVIMGDWITGLLEKIFSLLDAHEDPQKDSRSSVDGGVGETFGFLCQSINASAEPVLWNLVENKVIEYFKKSTPLNGVKVAGKIIESLVGSNPSCLQRVLGALLDSDIANGECSHDKLAFRLRLVGGGLRSSQGLSPAVISTLTPFFTSEYTHHSEKSVRKAAVKLVKDALKGSVSFYPKGISPYDSSLKAMIGAPNLFNKAQYSWYVPSNEALSTGAAILRSAAIQTMSEIVTLLSEISTVRFELFCNFKNASNNLMSPPLNFGRCDF